MVIVSVKQDALEGLSDAVAKSVKAIELQFWALLNLPKGEKMFDLNGFRKTTGVFCKKPTIFTMKRTVDDFVTVYISKVDEFWWYFDCVFGGAAPDSNSGVDMKIGLKTRPFHTVSHHDLRVGVRDGLSFEDVDARYHNLPSVLVMKLRALCFDSDASDRLFDMQGVGLSTDWTLIDPALDEETLIDNYATFVGAVWTCITAVDACALESDLRHLEFEDSSRSFERDISQPWTHQEKKGGASLVPLYAQQKKTGRMAFSLRMMITPSVDAYVALDRDGLVFVFVLFGDELKVGLILDKAKTLKDTTMMLRHPSSTFEEVNRAHNGLPALFLQTMKRPQEYHDLVCTLISNEHATNLLFEEEECRAEKKKKKKKKNKKKKTSLENENGGGGDLKGAVEDDADEDLLAVVDLANTASIVAGVTAFFAKEAENKTKLCGFDVLEEESDVLEEEEPLVATTDYANNAFTVSSKWIWLGAELGTIIANASSSTPVAAC